MAKGELEIMWFILIAICMNIFEHERITLKYVGIYIENLTKYRKQYSFLSGFIVKHSFLYL